MSVRGFRKQPGTRAFRAATVTTVAAAVTLVCATARVAAADGEPGPLAPGWRVSLGALSGSVLPDAALADYQWATLPRAAWGAQALAGRGPFEAGLRLWRTQTTQTAALPGATLSSAVHLTSLEAVSRVRLVRWLGTDLLGTAAAGRMRIDWDPDRVEFDAGGGTPVEVRFAPVDEWVLGAGLAVRRPLTAATSVGFEVERRGYRMDTAHRNGSTIEYRRETFGDWSARFELAWQSGPR